MLHPRWLGHHEGMCRPFARVPAALAAVLLGLVGSLALIAPAHAAGCSVMTFQFDPTTGAALSPPKLTVNQGACVILHNATITSAQFSVGAHYKSTAQPFSDAAPNYVAGPAGTTQAVTASSAAGTAHGSIVVTAAPSKPTPTPSHSQPPTAHPSPRPTHQAGSPPATPPTPPATTPTAAPPPVQPLVSPSVGSTPYLAGQPTPTPSPAQSSTAVVAGPLQPPTDRGTGLPAALAALAVVGTAGALLRVLLAEPVGAVDSGRTVGAAS